MNKRKPHIYLELESSSTAASRAHASQSPSPRSLGNKVSKPFNKHLNVRDCSIGRVVGWSGCLVNWAALSAAFIAENPGMEMQENFMSTLLTNKTGDDTFNRFAPPRASSSTRAALRPW